MVFRKKSLLFYEYEILTAITIMALLGVTLIIKSALPLIYALPLTVLLFLGPKLFFNELITVNETGISCHKAGRQLWAFAWEDIAALQKNKHDRWPTMVIEASNSCGGPDSREYCFQLSKTAKKAIEQYYNKAI